MSVISVAGGSKRGTNDLTVCDCAKQCRDLVESPLCEHLSDVVLQQLAIETWRPVVKGVRSPSGKRAGVVELLEVVSANGSQTLHPVGGTLAACLLGCVVELPLKFADRRVGGQKGRL